MAGAPEKTRTTPEGQPARGEVPSRRAEEELKAGEEPAVEQRPEAGEEPAVEQRPEAGQEAESEEKAGHPPGRRATTEDHEAGAAPGTDEERETREAAVAAEESVVAQLTRHVHAITDPESLDRHFQHAVEELGVLREEGRTCAAAEAAELRAAWLAAARRVRRSSSRLTEPQRQAVEAMPDRIRSAWEALDAITATTATAASGGGST